MTRLLIVTDHALIVAAIRSALRQTAGFEIVRCVDGRRPIDAAVAEARPDMVVLDDMRSDELALARLAEIARAAPRARCVLLASDMDPDRLDRLFAAGAGAVIAKTVQAGALGTLLRETARGTVVHPSRRAPATAPAADCPLTDRELEILRFAAQGHTNGRIARELWVTEQTVKFHLSNTYRKLGVANRTEASRYAHVHRLLEREPEPADAVPYPTAA
jgi:DNA-binding NarL/FixJ family response regulator